MKKRKYPYHRFRSEDFDIESALSNQECEIYDLVDFLLRETHRLRSLVLEARCQANGMALCHEEKPYPNIGGDAYNACFDDHPAMLRYYELYGDEAADGKY